MTLFKHEATEQVIDVNEVKPNVFNVLGTPMERSILNTCGWWECAPDPGYRGMPEASTQDLSRPGADFHPTTHVNESKGL